MTESTMPPALVDGRNCDGCTMCCKLMWVEALDKPRQKWCEHCRVGVGCAIYYRRPDECRTFHCSYLLDANLGDHWAPKVSRMVVSWRADQRQLTIHVDAGRLDVWRREPYQSEIRQWAEAVAKDEVQILVRQGADLIVLLPDRDKNLGPVADGWRVLTLRRDGPQGIEWDAMAVAPDDPRGAAPPSAK